MKTVTKATIAGMVVAVLIAGYVVFFSGPSAAYKAYVAYADAMAQARYDDAAALSVGQARSYAQAAKQGLTASASGAGIFGETAKSMIDVSGNVAWIRREVKAERSDAEGATQLSVVQQVCRLPPNAKRATCALPTAAIHDVRVRKEGGRLVVSSFNEERVREFK